MSVAQSCVERRSVRRVVSAATHAPLPRWVGLTYSTDVGRTAGIGATSPLPDTPAKVPSPNPQPPNARGSGDRAVIATGAC